VAPIPNRQPFPRRRVVQILGLYSALPSMDKTAGMFDKIVQNGPYSDVAPRAQLRIGAAREKQKDFPAAVKAYEMPLTAITASRRLPPTRCSTKVFRIRNRRRAPNYDQSAAVQAIAASPISSRFIRTTSAFRRRERPSPCLKRNRCV